MKQWQTVHKYKGYEIQVLNGAEEYDLMGYRIVPELPSRGGEYWDCVGDAIEAIDKALYII